MFISNMDSDLRCPFDRQKIKRGYAALHKVSFVYGKMHSDWFNGTEILQGRWQNGEQVGYCYPSGLEKTLCKWDIHVPLVTKRLKDRNMSNLQ
jgi:hypothetical protein